jgi:hypothetical protein
MVEKITCPVCGAETFKTEFCTNCGNQMSLNGKEKVLTQLRRQNEQTDFEIIEKMFESKYKQIVEASYNGLMQTYLGRFAMYLDQKGKGRFSGLKQLIVPRNSKAVVFSEYGAVDKVFYTGTYDISSSSKDTNELKNFIRKNKRDRIFICITRDESIQVSLTIPSMKVDNDGKSHIPMNLASSNIRSVEGYVGGVTMDVLFSINNPFAILDTYEHIAFHESTGESFVQHQSVRMRELLALPFRKLSEAMSSINYFSSFFNRHEYKLEMPSLTMIDFWNLMQAEFIQAIQTTVLNETAVDMYSMIDVRKRIEVSIKSMMEATFNRFGMTLERINSFRFLCPQYESIIQGEANIAQEESELQTEIRKSDLRQEKRKLSKNDAFNISDVNQDITEKNITSERDVRVLKENSRADIEEAEDDRVANRQNRELNMKGQQNDFRREQLAADEQLQIEMQTMKMRKMIELRNMMLDGDNQREIAQARAFSEMGLSSETILAMQLKNNPELAQAYIEAVKSRSAEEKLKLHEYFEERLLNANSQDKANVQKLLEVGIEQLGKVMTASQKAKRIQIANPNQTGYANKDSN